LILRGSEATAYPGVRNLCAVSISPSRHRDPSAKIIAVEPDIDHDDLDSLDPETAARVRGYYRIVGLAISYHDEAEQCAQVQCYNVRATFDHTYAILVATA